MSAPLPARGPAVRDSGLALPPAAMRALRGGRPLKRWRYVAAFGEELALCAAYVQVGPLGRGFWAVAEPGRLLAGRATMRRGGVWVEPGSVRVRAPGAAIDLELDEADAPPAVESVSPSGPRGYVWTRKQAGVPARGTVALGGRTAQPVELLAVVDETAGYHARRTEWYWSAGVGRAEDGRSVGWNLVEGVNDDAEASERTVWIGGEPSHVAPVAFAADLSEVRFAPGDGGGALRFEPWAVFESVIRVPPLLASRYRHPFGAFGGELPGGVRLAEGRGVMERHEAVW